MVLFKQMMKIGGRCNCSRVSHIFLEIVIHPDVINDVAHSVNLKVRG